MICWKRDIALYQKQQFRYQIIDGSPVHQEPDDSGSQGGEGHSVRMPFRLDRTPVENRLSELWSIFDYLMPGFLYTCR